MNMTRKPTTGPFTSIAAIRAANESAGQHYFEPDTMRFFNSMVIDTVRAGRYFITSECFDVETHPRLYSIHVALNNAHVESVGEFQAYPDSGSALEALDEALDLGLTVRLADDAPAEPDPEHYHWQVHLGDLSVYYKTSKAKAEALLAELAE